MEHFTFELILHFDPEYVGSINGLKAHITSAIERCAALDDLADMELNLTERTYNDASKLPD